MMSTNLNNIAILNIKGADYCCIINGITKSDALNLLKKYRFDRKRSIIKIKKLIKNISPYIKWVKKL